MNSIVYTFLAFVLVMFTFVRENELRATVLTIWNTIRGFGSLRRIYLTVSYPISIKLVKFSPQTFLCFEQSIPLNSNGFRYLSSLTHSRTLPHIRTSILFIFVSFVRSFVSFLFSFFHFFFVTKNGAWYEQNRKIMCFSFSKEREKKQNSISFSSKDIISVRAGKMPFQWNFREMNDARKKIIHAVKQLLISCFISPSTLFLLAKIWMFSLSLSLFVCVLFWRIASLMI